MITEVTRRAIADALSAGHHDWAGRLSETDFLSRLYDLAELPSHDHRYQTARGDIGCHRESFRDWEDDWVFYDTRFNLIRCDDAEFLRFLVETVHPVVRSEEGQACDLVAIYNGELRRDGWELVQVGELSGRPRFAAQPVDAVAEIFEEPTGWAKVDRQVLELRARMREANVEEQFQSIGHMCREVLISLAQTVYDPARHPSQDGVIPSSSDAKRMLEAFIAVELAGTGNAGARKHARASFDLANELQHDRTATFRDAALCAEAALSVVRIAAIVTGRRDHAID